MTYKNKKYIVKYSTYKILYLKKAMRPSNWVITIIYFMEKYIEIEDFVFYIASKYLSIAGQTH